MDMNPVHNTAPYGTGEGALFKPLNAEDVKFYTGKVMESKKRVDKIDGYLAKKQWPEVQSELTRQVRAFWLSLVAWSTTCPLPCLPLPPSRPN